MGSLQESLEDNDGKEEIEKFWSITRRLTLADNYSFMDFYQRFVIASAQGTVSEAMNNICDGAYEYSGNDKCLHNIAHALLDVKNWLVTEFSSNPQDWAYRNVHINEYAAAPWSLTKLKTFWHRKVPVGGNGNTPCVSKGSMGTIEKNKVIAATHTANYK